MKIHGKGSGAIRVEPSLTDLEFKSFLFPRLYREELIFLLKVGGFDTVPLHYNGFVCKDFQSLLMK